jgi:hypothetical protein
MPEAEDLRSTSDGILRDLEVLSAIEEQKRTLEPGDPRIVELAKRVEEVATRVLAASVRQRQLAEINKAKVDAGVATTPETSINDTPRPIADILAGWRAAELRLEVAEPGSAETAEAEALSDQLREEYRRAFESRQDASRQD